MIQTTTQNTFTIRGRKSPEEAQAIVTRLNPYRAFSNRESREGWEKDVGGISYAKIYILDGLGFAALGILSAPTVNEPASVDWVVYVLLPFHRSTDKAHSFIAVPLGHGRSNVIGAAVLVGEAISIAENQKLTAAPVKVWRDAEDTPVAAVILGSAYWPIPDATQEAAPESDDSVKKDEDENDRKPRTLEASFIAVGIHPTDGVVLLSGPQSGKGVTLEDAVALAEEYATEVLGKNSGT